MATKKTKEADKAKKTATVKKKAAPTGPAAKKTSAKKTSVKKTAANKPAAKKTAAKKTAAKKTAAKKTSAKKTSAKKTTRKAAAAKRSPASKKASGAPSPDDKAAFAPGSLVKHADNYSLVYAKFPHVPAFDEHGIEGGGYTWHGLVVHVLEADDPKALDALDFDPEAGMFCALSEDLGALAAVGRALKKLEDPALLTKLAGTVDLGDYD